METLINLDVPQTCPRDMTIAPESEDIASRARGEFCPFYVHHYSPEHNHPDRLRSKGTTVREIMKELASDKVPVLSANVLWWFLSNKKMIKGLKPCEWDTKRYCPTLYFFGTIYISEEGSPCVLGLKWDEYSDDWCWTKRDLDAAWNGGLVAIPSAG